MMRLRGVIFLTLIFSAVAIASTAFTKEETLQGKKVKYRKYTAIDFTAQTVEGKTRMPELFYIFQRKRSSGHRVVLVPERFGSHRGLTHDALRGALPQ